MNLSCDLFISDTISKSTHFEISILEYNYVVDLIRITYTLNFKMNSLIHLLLLIINIIEMCNFSRFII